MASDRTDGGLNRNFGHNVGPTVKTLTLVSGTALQPHVAKDNIVYVQITGHAAGTYQVDIGPDSTVANSIVAAAGGAPASTDLLVTVNLPGGWFIKVTVGGSAAIAQAVSISD